MFHEYTVSTTHQDVVKHMEAYVDCDKIKVLCIFNDVLKDLKQFTLDKLEDHRLNNTKEWFSWCNDVLVYNLLLSKIHKTLNYSYMYINI